MVSNEVVNDRARIIGQILRISQFEWSVLSRDKMLDEYLFPIITDTIPEDIERLLV